MKNLIEKLRASVSAQAALIVTVPLVVILSLHSYIEYRTNRGQLLRNTEMQLLRIAEGMISPAEEFIAKRNTAGLQSLVDDVANGSNVELVTLFDPRGIVAASNRKKWIGKPMIAMYPEDITENDRASIDKALTGGYSAYFDPDDMQDCIVLPIVYGAAGTGAMHIGMDLLSLTEENRKSAVRVVLGAVLAALLIGVTIYYMLRARITRRLTNISLTAARIAGGDLAARTQVRGTDEIGRLAASFNTLADETERRKNHLEEMVEFRVHELSGLYSVVEATSQSLDLEIMLPVVLRCVLRMTGVEQGIVLLREEKTGAVRLAAHSGFAPESVLALERQKHGEGFAGAVMARNRTIRTGDAAAEKDVAVLPGLEREEIRSVLAVPIAFVQKSLGAIAVYSRQTDRFSENDEKLLGSIGAQVGVAVENCRLYARTLELACEDGLTGLANRRHFMDLLEREAARAARYSIPFTVLIMDLDHFKKFNDAYGHLKGDDLLRSFSAVVLQSLRFSDVAGRYGGEEFTVILPNTPLQGGLVTAERIRKACDELRVPLGEGRADGVTVSIGAAEFSAGESIESLLQAADSALYRAKEGGRNRVEYRDRNSA